MFLRHVTADENVRREFVSRDCDGSLLTIHYSLFSEEGPDAQKRKRAKYR